MQQFLDEVRGGCGDRGIDYLLLRTDQPLADALSATTCTPASG